MVFKIKNFEVEMKSKEGFIFTYIPIIKVKASDKGEAETKAFNYADKKLNFRRIAIEIVNIKEVEQ
jgi:hypothetical protein